MLKRTAFAPGLFAAFGAAFCTVYHTTAVYSYGPAKRDYQYGWPFRYGFDQHDVVGEYLWMLASFNFPAFVADVAIGVGSGLIVASLIGFVRRPDVHHNHAA